jgi:hypothetical protein
MKRHLHIISVAIVDAMFELVALGASLALASALAR